MADVEIKCGQCATVTRVSEFVDPKALQCAKCGAALEKPANAGTRAGRPALTFKRDREDAQPDAEGWKKLFQPPPLQKRRKSEWRLSQIVFSWLLFLALAAGTGYLRYGQVLRPEHLDLAARFAPLVVTAFYLIIVLKAFNDSMFCGMLCLFIPPYALFYLFFQCDDFYARAVLAGLLVGFGQDAGLFFQVKIVTASVAVREWIGAGGSAIR